MANVWGIEMANVVGYTKRYGDSQSKPRWQPSTKVDDDLLLEVARLRAALARRDNLLRVAAGALKLVDHVLADKPNARFIQIIEDELTGGSK